MTLFNRPVHFHGEVWSLPWEVRVEEDSPRRVRVAFTVRTRQTPFLLERALTLEAGSPAVRIDETVRNLSGRRIDFMWGHHPCFGAPLVSPRSVLYAPAKTVCLNLAHRTDWPRGTVAGKTIDFSRPPAPKSGVSRMLYLEKLREGWYALVNPGLKMGFGMRWDKKRFPLVWIWQEAGGNTDSPWFGDTYAMAVEPFNSLPGARQRGEKLSVLPARGSLTTRLYACAIPGARPVKGIDAGGRVRR